ncbi:MAG: protoglobin domain-containing protein [Myxococcota bacterium]
MAGYALFQELRADAGFDDDAAASVQRARPLLQPRFEGIVETFYAKIESSASMRELFADEAQLKRQRGSLRAWLETLLTGPYDAAYFELRCRIGRAHVRIQMPQHHMFSMMSLLRTGLQEALAEEAARAGWSVEAQRAGQLALDRLIDVELGVMLETYREDYVERLRASERLAAIGQLAATIGHELRNPLAVIDTSLHLLERRLGEDPTARRHATKIGAQVGVCGEIITDLLMLARDRPPERHLAPVGPIVASALEGLVRYDTKLTVDVPDDLPAAFVDAGQIRQVIANLVSNGIHAVQAGPHRDGKVELAAMQVGDSLALEVRDEGQGITAEVRARLFEPLFTTRAQGVGLGLALVRRVVEGHGGTVEAHARNEGGACFRIELPGAFRKREGVAPAGAREAS